MGDNRVEQANRDATQRWPGLGAGGEVGHDAGDDVVGGRREQVVPVRDVVIYRPVSGGQAHGERPQGQSVLALSVKNLDSGLDALSSVVILSGLASLSLPGGGRRVVPGGCRFLGRRGSKPRLAWLRDCSDYGGVSLVLVLVLVGAGAAIWWRVSHAKWGLVRRVVFWVVLVVVLWVLVNYYSVPLPEV